MPKIYQINSIWLVVLAKVIRPVSVRLEIPCIGIGIGKSINEDIITKIVILLAAFLHFYIPYIETTNCFHVVRILPYIVY